MEGVAAGDRLRSVNGIVITGATMGKLLRMLHGRPGETRKLTLELHRREFIVNARVTSI